MGFQKIARSCWLTLSAYDFVEGNAPSLVERSFVQLGQNIECHVFSRSNEQVIRRFRGWHL